MTQSHNTPVFAKVWLMLSLLYLRNIFSPPNKILKSNLELLAMFILSNENIFLFKFQRHSTLTYKWSSDYSFCFFHKQNKNTFNNESPKLLSDNACQHPCSLWGVQISAVSSTLHVLVTFLCPVLYFLFERHKWQRTRVGNVLCVSEATQEGCYGLA